MTWDYTDANFEEQATTDPIWYLERVINYGTPHQKLHRDQLKQYLSQLKIPQQRRDFFELLLWDKPF